MSNATNQTSELLDITPEAMYMVYAIPVAEDIRKAAGEYSDKPYGRSPGEWRPYYFTYYDAATQGNTFDAMTIDELREVANDEWLEHEQSFDATLQEIRWVDLESYESTAEVFELVKGWGDEAKTLFILVTDVCGMIVARLRERHDTLAGLARCVVYPCCVLRQPHRKIELSLRLLIRQTTYAGSPAHPTNGYACKELFVNVLFAASKPEAFAHFLDSRERARWIHDHRLRLDDLDL